MALTEESGLVMPVAPMSSGGGMGSGYGFGGDGWWILLLFILLGGRGWGNGVTGGSTTSDLYPWMNQSNQISEGFNDLMLNSNIDSIQNGINGIQNQLCNGFAQAEIANNARQIANMQQIYGLSSQFADCCCENRLATADLRYTIATENCADRAAISDGIRDVLTNQNANTQRILDTLCQDKIDAKNEKIADLERQLTMANLSASQIAQTAQIRAGQTAEVDALYNRLSQCPVPCMPVYGMQPIFTCGGNNNGCGCNGNF